MFTFLPLNWLYAIGKLIGKLAYHASASYAAHLEQNLKQSAIALDHAEFKKLLNNSINETGKTFIDTLVAWSRSERSIIGLVKKCTGWEHVEQALAQKRGLILLTPHLGAFEIASIYIATRIPLTVMYRAPRLRVLEPLMIAGRKRGMANLATADMRGVRTIYRALKKGEAVGLLPDQVPSKGDGVWAPFFDRPAYTMTLVGRLQRTTGAEILMVIAERLPDGEGYHLEFEPFSAHLPEDSKVAAKILNKTLENIIRRYPTQYLWGYNRYKTPKSMGKQQS